MKRRWACQGFCADPGHNTHLWNGSLSVEPASNALEFQWEVHTLPLAFCFSALVLNSRLQLSPLQLCLHWNVFGWESLTFKLSVCLASFLTTQRNTTQLQFRHSEILGSSETAQQVKRFAAKTGNLSSDPRIHMVEGEPNLCSCPLISTFILYHVYKHAGHMCTGMHSHARAHTCTCTHK